MQDTTEKLNCEIDTPEMGERVLAAANEANLNGWWQVWRAEMYLTSVFEHGQWWIIQPATGAQWSVCDTDTGFDFEMVTEPEEPED